MRRIWVAAGVAAVAGGGAATLATAARDTPPARAAAEPGQTASAVLRDAEGRRVGHAVLVRRGRRTFVAVRVRGLQPGFHGFHVHAVGACEPPFTSAGGHLAEEGQQHRQHVGDLPSLLVRDDGRAELATATDRFTPRELRAGDGSAIIVHAGPDNFANIPERYATQDGQRGPDAETLRTGDSGARVACGVVR